MTGLEHQKKERLKALSTGDRENSDDKEMQRMKGIEKDKKKKTIGKGRRQ